MRLRAFVWISHVSLTQRLRSEGFGLRLEGSRVVISRVIGLSWGYKPAKP